MLKIGNTYTFHGDFNYGFKVTGVLNEVDDNFMKFVNCSDLRDDGNIIIVNIRNVHAIYPGKV